MSKHTRTHRGQAQTNDGDNTRAIPGGPNMEVQGRTPTFKGLGNQGHSQGLDESGFRVGIPGQHDSDIRSYFGPAGRQDHVEPSLTRRGDLPRKGRGLPVPGRTEGT